MEWQVARNSWCGTGGRGRAGEGESEGRRMVQEEISRFSISGAHVHWAARVNGGGNYDSLKVAKWLLSEASVRKTHVGLLPFVSTRRVMSWSTRVSY